MIQLITNFELHNTKHKIYVVKDKEIFYVAEPDNMEDYLTEIFNLYTMYNPDKIAFFGNDLLMAHYEKNIIEKNKSQYNLTISIEKNSKNSKEIQL